MENDYLNFEIGTEDLQKVTVTAISVENIPISNELTRKRITLKVLDPGGDQYEINDAFVNGSEKSHGLWLSFSAKTRLNPKSTLAKVLKFYKCKKPSELLGKKVFIKYNEREFLSILA